MPSKDQTTSRAPSTQNKGFKCWQLNRCVIPAEEQVGLHTSASLLWKAVVIQRPRTPLFRQISHEQIHSLRPSSLKLNYKAKSERAFSCTGPAFKRKMDLCLTVARERPCSYTESIAFFAFLTCFVSRKKSLHLKSEGKGGGEEKTHTVTADTQSQRKALG